MMGGFVSKFLFLLSVSLVPAAAVAQEEKAPSCYDLYGNDGITGCGTRTPLAIDDLEPVSVDDATITVTATGLGTDISNTGQPVTIIDRPEIESVQGADATRVLVRTPGLAVSRNGGAGTFTGVSLRGANAEQLLVLVDGVRVADPASPAGGFDFGNLLTGTTGKFDLLRGSNSTIWGSDAIGGVLDVSTRGGEGLSGSLEYGSRDTLFASAAGGIGGESYFAGLTGSWLRTDGFSSAASGTETDGFEQFALGGSAFIDLAPGLELFAHANWSKGELDLDGFPAPAFALADTLETQETRRHWGDVGLAYRANDLTLRAAYSLADTERDNLDPVFGPTFTSDGHSERVSLRGEYLVIGGLSLAFGGEHDWTDFATLFDDGAEAGITGAYAQLGWIMGDLAAHLGARVDDHSRFGTHTSFGGDVSYGLGRDWRVRASIGEGFKAPTLFQLFSDFGNLALEPEESTSFDLGLEKGRRGKGTHLALTAFRRDSEDLIGFVSCFQVTGGICENRPFGTYDNIARARAQGIELEVGAVVAEGLRLSGVYAYIEAEDRIGRRDLARRPHHAATLFADYSAAFGLKLGADLRLVSDSFEDVANTVPLEGYGLLDLRAAMPVSEPFELFGRVENVFDNDYQTAAGYAAPGRGAFVGVRARM